MSKSEALRGFVTERLAAASREILAAVDRIVAEYEEEASGFRLEIDRQKKQLEELTVTPNTEGVERCKGIRTYEEDEEEDSTNSAASGCRFKKRKSYRPVNLMIRILEDPQITVLSNNILEKCPLHKLKCPRDLQESDFLDLLRSTFPQLSGDDKLFDVLTADGRRRLHPLQLKTVTPQEIHGNFSCSERRKSTIYIRLKTQKRNYEEDTDPLQRKENSDVSVSTSDVLMCDPTRYFCQQKLRRRSVMVSDFVMDNEDDPQPDLFEPEHTEEELQVLEEERARREAEAAEQSGAIGYRDEVSHSSTSNRPDVEIEEAHSCGLLEPLDGSGGKGDESDQMERVEKGGDSEEDWKPDKSDEELKGSDEELHTTKKQKLKRPGVKETENVDAFTCRVCGALQESEVLLIKHSWSHIGDPGGLCGVCGDHSDSPEALKEHHVSHHKTEDCHMCGESFSCDLSFNEHVAAHAGEKPYECDVCPERFALEASLENHRELHEASKLHKCHTCGKMFGQKSLLRAHQMTHTHLCGVCGKSLSDYRSLARHKMTHIEERPHSCEVCGRSFKLLGTLRQHQKIHTERERSYLCDVCCKMFLTSKQLQVHMRTHTDEKPYQCVKCGKGFNTKGALTVHIRVHTGETPYRCPDCGWSFKRKVHLDNHMTVHSDLKPFVCLICGKACARKKYLKVHMRTHNGERPYKCSLCDKAFTQGHCLKTHMKSHGGGEAAT